VFSRPPLASGRRIGALAVATLFATCVPTRSSRGAPAPPPDDLGARPIELSSAAGGTVRGWFVPGRPGAGAVLLLHGIGASRRDMLGRARFLGANGFSVLLVDFRGHGDSAAARSTYGSLESHDARAAVDFLRAALPGERIGVIGISMGGAAALLGPAPLPVQVLVLESVYPTIGDAVRGRLGAWLGAIGQALAPSVLSWLFPREGVTADQLRPIDRIGEQTAAVLLLAGTDDRYTPVREARALFARAPEPKALWEVPGAAHVDLHAFSGVEYERRVGAFLARHLRDLADGGSGVIGDGASPAPRAQPEQQAQRAARGDDPAQRRGPEE
jgi:pimeloyl-ACP methyl ester carboxylesterase